MNPVGDPYSETAAIDDHRGEPLTVTVDEDALEGVHTPKLIVAIQTAGDDTEALAVIEEPAAGVWRIEKQ